METNQSRDIQLFIKKFEPTKFKILSNGIEIRGAKDIFKSVAYAKALIEKLKLRLSVKHTAEMASYGGIEILNIDA